MKLNVLCDCHGQASGKFQDLSTYETARYANSQWGEIVVQVPTNMTDERKQEWKKYGFVPNSGRTIPKSEWTPDMKDEAYKQNSD